MAKKRNRKRADHPREPRRPTIARRQTGRTTRSDPSPEAQPLIQQLKRALYGEHPLDLLETVSGLLAATEKRPSLTGETPPAVSLEDLVESFLGTDFAPTTAALHVIAAFTEDDLLRARIDRELRTRTQPMPAWLSGLRRTTLGGVTLILHVLRDGEDYLLDVRLPDGYVATAVVYVDNNLGQVVKDAFVVPRAAANVRDRIVDLHRVEAGRHPEDFRVEDMDLGPVRTLLDDAVLGGSITVPPLESDTWPLSRPLVRWLIGLLPGGAPRPEPPEVDHDEVVEAFVASPYGAVYDDEDHRSIAHSLVWLGTSYGIGDPLLISSVTVELLLADRVPRKVVSPLEDLVRLPALLRDFIRFGHAERGIGAHLTAEALAAVDRWEPEYQRLIRTDRPQGAQALARMVLEASGGPAWGQHPLEDLVGGPAALAALTAGPLPDEEFDWSGIPEDLHAKLGEILRLCDESAEEFLDIEHRTASRRLLRALAVADPAYFRGRAAARTSGAAIAWMIAHANDSAGPHRDVTFAELFEPFGVSSAGQRAAKFRDILGLPEHTPSMGPLALGSPDYLVGQRRAELLEERDLD